MTTCAAPRHDGDQADTEAQSKQYKACRLGLWWDLRNLPALDRKLSTLSIIRASPGNGAVPLPFDENISDWRQQFRRNVFHGFDAATTDRGYCPVLAQSDVYAMCGWLRPQVSKSDKHPAWIPYRDWAPYWADALHKTRVRGEQLADPLQIVRVFIPAPCLDCGNGRMDAVIYADHAQGKWSYWVCPACRTATQIEAWWDYQKRLAAMRANLQPVVER